MHALDETEAVEVVSVETAAIVGATPAARRAITALRAARGPLMFVLSAGCCGGTAPMCYPSGEFQLADADLLLGVIDGCPFYMEARHYAAWRAPRFVLDVEPGFAEGFSLPAGDGVAREIQHWVIRSTTPPPSCEARP